MRVWRIARRAFQALDGEGARRFGGRWNSPGRAVVYASETLSLAALEYLAHIDPPLVPDDLVALHIDVPESPGAAVEVDQFPDPDWRGYPAVEWQQELGDLWVADGTFLWLAVPSAIVPEEYNVLLNAAHPRMRDVTVVEVRDFRFDQRLV